MSQNERLLYRYNLLDKNGRRSFRKVYIQNQNYAGNYFSKDILLAFTEGLWSDDWYEILDNTGICHHDETLKEIIELAPNKDEIDAYLKQLDEEWNLFTALKHTCLSYFDSSEPLPVLFFKCLKCGDTFYSEDNQETELCPYCKSR